LAYKCKTAHTKLTQDKKDSKTSMANMTDRENFDRYNESSLISKKYGRFTQNTQKCETKNKTDTKVTGININDKI